MPFILCYLQEILQKKVRKINLYSLMLGPSLGARGDYTTGGVLTLDTGTYMIWCRRALPPKWCGPETYVRVLNFRVGATSYTVIHFVT